MPLKFSGSITRDMKKVGKGLRGKEKDNGFDASTTSRAREEKDRRRGRRTDCKRGRVLGS